MTGQTHFQKEQAIGERVRAAHKASAQAATKAGFERAQAEQKDSAAAQALKKDVSSAGSVRGNDNRKKSTSDKFSQAAGRETPLGEFGHKLSDHGNEIRFSRGRRGLTPHQAQEIIKRALDKGWSRLYVFGEYGGVDVKAAKQLQDMIVKMGVQDRISCVTTRRGHGFMYPGYLLMKKFSRSSRGGSQHDADDVAEPASAPRRHAGFALRPQ